jgi:hypothetical protein
LPSAEPAASFHDMSRLPLFCVMLAACAEETPGPPPVASPWRPVFEHLDGALISLWGTSAGDLWVVGGDAGAGPVVLRREGTAWRRVETGSTGALWWVHGFAGGPVLAGGEGGRILRLDAEPIVAPATPGSSTVFGIWGASADDVWAVGGEPVGSTGAFVWHWTGGQWLDAGAPVETAAYYKVWGDSAADVWIVGTEGTLLHWTPDDGFAVVTSPTSRTLLTVHTAPGGRAAAVGGYGTGVLIERRGDAWVDATPAGTVPQLFGVRLTGESEGWAVGLEGVAFHRDASGWSAEAMPTVQGFHAVWIDPEGGVWAAGGEIMTTLDDGTLYYRGAAEVGGELH